MITKTYHELVQIPTFKERFDYLSNSVRVGEMTFGGERYLNQRFYRSAEWRNLRNQIIVRDSLNGSLPCDLACLDHPIRGRVVIHHMNPLTIKDIDEASPNLLDPEYLVCVSELTHKALHYGSLDSLPLPYVPRYRNDTCPWKEGSK